MKRGVIGGILSIVLLLANFVLAETMPGVHFSQTGYQLVNNDIKIEFLPTGDRYMIAEVFLRYRPMGELDFKQVRMTLNGLKYEVQIDQREVPARTFEYDFAITDRKGNSYLYSASEVGDMPFRYSLQQQDNIEESEMVDAVVISPLQGETVSEDDFIGVVSLLNIPQNFSLVRTKIFIDGIDYTGDGNIGERVITFTPSSLEPGLHSVQVQFYGANGKQLNKLEWDFTLLRALDNRPSEGPFRINGRAYVHNRYENIRDGEFKKNYLRGGVDFNGQFAMIDFGGRFYSSSEESENLQPINIYNVYAKLKFGENWYVMLNGIDNYPNYNKRVVKDTRIRGVGGTAKIGWFELSGAYGTSRRAITGSINEVATGVDPNSGDTTFVKNAYAYTFDREDFAGRFGVGSHDGLLVGLSFYKSKDDEQSFSVNGATSADGAVALSGVKPRENVVAGVDFSLKLLNRKIEFFGVGAASIVNNDIQGGSVPYDTLSKYSEAPPEEEIYDLASKFMTVNTGLVTDPGVSFETGVKLKFFGNFLQAKFELANKQFTSFGLQYVRNDYDAIRISDGLAIFDNTLSLNVGYDIINSNKSFDNKITTNQLFFNAGYNPGPALPSVAFNFTNLGRTSDQPTNPVDETFRTIALSGGYLVNLFGLNNNLQVTYSQTTREDPGSTVANSTANVLNFTIRTRFNFPLQARLSVDKNLTDTGNDSTFYNSDFTAVTLGADYQIAKIFTNWDFSVGGYAKMGNIVDEASLAGTTDAVRNLFNFKVSLDMKKLGMVYSGVDFYTYSSDTFGDQQDMIWTTRYSINF